MEVAAGTVGAPALSRQKAGSSQVPPLTPAWGGPGDRVGGDSASSPPSALLLQGCFYQVWESMEAPGQLWISRLAADNPGSRGSRLLCVRLFVLLLPSVSSPGNRKQFCAMGSDRKLVTDGFIHLLVPRLGWMKGCLSQDPLWVWGLQGRWTSLVLAWP